MWRIARYILGLALAGIALYALTGRSAELTGAGEYLENLHWTLFGLAMLAEAWSYLAYASLQRVLLGAGTVTVPLPAMTGISLAGNSIQNSLPGGVFLSSAYAFRQYRRFGADEVLSGWVVLAMNSASMVTLTIISAVGLGLAFGTGNALDLVSVIVGVVLFASLVVLLWVKRQWVLARSTWAARLYQRLRHRPLEDAPRMLERATERLNTVAPSRDEWTQAAIAAMANWVFDGACLMLAFGAVGAPVPWRGIVLAYSAAQLAANLPVTPGGLGVVEGSLTLALVSFGGDHATTVAAVLVYRLINFWILLPVGWSAWGILAFAGRRQLRREDYARRSKIAVAQSGTSWPGDEASR